MNKEKISFIKKEIQYFGSFKAPTVTQAMLLAKYRAALRELEREEDNIW